MPEKIKSGKLSKISVDEIVHNPENPRLLFDPKPLEVLKKSIREVGILNPLLVYRRKKDNKIVILDGERRWQCAKNLGMSSIPANIIEEPTPLQNIIQMFNIHNIREPWELMPTALKLEVIMRTTKIKNDTELAAMTSLKISTVKRCKILLSFHKKYQDLMLVEEPKKRMKTDFFIEMYPILNLIEKKLKRVHKKFEREKIIDILLEKYEKGIFTNVTHSREIVNFIRSVEKGILSKKVVEDKIIYFLEHKNVALKDMIEVEDIGIKLNFKKTIEMITRKLNKTSISNLDYNSLLSLKKVIDDKIKKIEKSGKYE